MFEKNLESVIGIDTDKGEVHFYSADKGDKDSISYFTGSYKAKPFSKEFYEKLGSIIERYRENNHAGSSQKVSLVLSDSTVLTDTINLPIINKKAMDTSLDASLSNLYGGVDIKFNRLLAMQNKQFATYAVAGMRMDTLVKLQNLLADNQMGVANVTYFSAAATNAAIMLNPKLKNASFVLLDIKDDFTRIVLVVKGRTLGFYSLPFGSGVLKSDLVEAEDMLFDHASAELLVLNAKEKAKAKALTAAEDFMALPLTEEEESTETPAEEIATEQTTAEDDEDYEDEDEEVEVLEPIVLSGKVRKKTPRKLPKYMQRPIPESEQAFVYENFRVFVKWTLEFIANNSSITSIGAPEAVYVNMPDEYSFLYDMVNSEAEENGIRFMPLSTEKNEIVRKNLELYGGFFAKQLNKFNNFHSTQLDTIKTKKSEKALAKANPGGKSVGEVLKSVWAFIKKIATYEIGGKK